MTERFNLERERPFVSFKVRGMTLEIFSARVRVDFVLPYENLSGATSQNLLHAHIRMDTGSTSPALEHKRRRL